MTDQPAAGRGGGEVMVNPYVVLRATPDSIHRWEVIGAFSGVVTATAIAYDVRGSIPNTLDVRVLVIVPGEPVREIELIS